MKGFDLVIGLLYLLLYVVLLVGVVWVINWAVDNIAQPLPAGVKLIVKAVIGIFGLIILLGFISGQIALPKV